MKRIILLCASILLLIYLAGCTRNEDSRNTEKYSMNSSVAYGSADADSLDKTTITYKIAIDGKKQDIENIASQEVIINMDYLDLLLEDESHSSELKNEEQQPYLEISGSFIFDTSGKSKEEIISMNLLQGVKIIDKDKNEYLLKFNN